ncbi:VF530 family protein [Enterovibrio coralii]|uniref:Transporter n=1 Tax=Enterovibrio coralii TaxID=294935 RepID=A0A135I9F0_9GAMM|nr:VF530 family protein [Enterovibrio coralii]KXF82080.1 hypothetical protein ATN88_19975 [Enterovibrio coralii]
MNDQPNNPLHGVKLEQIINELVDHYGWETLAREVAINCFRNDPSVKSSLKFLRKTPWAREKVELLYIDTFHSGAAPKAAANPWDAAMKKLNND